MITRAIKFTVVPEHTDAFKASFEVARVGALQEPGFEQVRLFAAREDPHTFFAYERLRDQAAQDAHAALPHTRQLFEFLEGSGTRVAQFDSGDTDPAPIPLPGDSEPGADELAVFFIFTLRAGFRERVLAQFATHIHHAREESGNVVFDLYTVDGHDDTLVVYERWRSESALMDVHFATPYARKTGALLEDAVPGSVEACMHFVTDIRPVASGTSA